MWFDGSLYVAAPPSIWKLTDTNGDGVADEREEWFQGRTLTGCANDLHGPYLGPDGWIYWTKGAFAEQTYERPGKAPLVTRAAHIFRRRPGAAAIEAVMTGGMDNPVEVAFTSTGERLLTATFLEHPQMGRRDAIIHAVYGGVYGKPHAVVDGHRRTGDLMPVMAHLGPAVPVGLARYRSTAFGAEYRDSFFATMFNLRKVSRLVLDPSGSTFTSRESDFVVSSNRDFHPTDVIEDADGSLLVIDTGPWYKLCCPTSQLAKPDVHGGIYRVRRSAAPKPADPRGRSLSWSGLPAEALVARLGDERPAVQERALRQIAKVGVAAVPALEKLLASSAPVEVRTNAIWGLTRIDDERARAAVRPALGDTNETIRHTALHAVSVWRDRGAASQVIAALKSGPPALQRAAAEALGRIGDAAAVPALVAAAAADTDRVLAHSITFALIEIGNAEATRTAAAQSASPRSRRAVLIALDQMEGGRLEPESIVALLDSTDPILSETAWWIAGRHPEWGGAMAGYFAERLARTGSAAVDPAQLLDRIVQFGANPAIQELLAKMAVDGSHAARQRTALAAMARIRLKTLPDVWRAPIASALTSGDAEAAPLAIAVLRAAPVADAARAAIDAALLQVARHPTHPVGLRIDALSAARPGPNLDDNLFGLLQEGLASSQPLQVRAAAAGVVEKATFGEPQLAALAGRLDTVGPLELPRVLRAFAGGGSEQLGQAVVAALERSAARASLRPDALRSSLEKYPAPVKQKAEALIASLDTSTAREAKRLEELLSNLGTGDVRRGQEIFNSQKAACLSCHTIGYIGGRIGPDLTRIGQVRSERDLLEAIVFPNASFARGYEPVTIRTTSGDLYNGVVRDELTDEVVLTTVTNQDTRIRRRDIAEIQSGTVSLMPPGFDQVLTRQELADLLAFLKDTRWGAD
jgi:putative heme-binding domain-containing protein